MISILGFVAIIIFTIQVYKAAKSTERNAGLWAMICAVVGFGLQFVVPIAFSMVLAIYYTLTGTPPEGLEDELTGPATIIGILGLILSIVGMVLIAKHVSKVTTETMTTVAPPPPPNFN